MVNRREFVMGALALLAAAPLPALAQNAPAIHVLKGRGCGCCGAWIEILKADGFRVTEEELMPADLVQAKLKRRIPQALSSCHTAEIEGYVVEGHVPVGDIRRLIAERPDAVGLTVPGMPYGSPGMGPESEREAYEVLLIGRDGSSQVFTRYAAGAG